MSAAIEFHRVCKRFGALQALDTACGARQQHQVGPLGHDAFDVRVNAATHARQGFDAFGPVGITVHAHQALALAKRADGFGQRGQQADNALRWAFELQGLLAVVEHGGGRTGQRVQQRKRAPEQQGPDSGCAAPARALSHGAPPIAR